MAEAAVVLAALGALGTALLRRHRRLGLVAGGTLGLAALVALLLSAALPAAGLVPGLSLPPPVLVLLVATGLSLGMIVVLAPSSVDRQGLLAAGLAGFAGLGVAGLAPDPVGVGLAIALLGVGHAALPGLRSFASRLRAPGLAVVLLGAGTLLVHTEGPPLQARLGALALLLSLVAAAGLVPFLPELDSDEPAPASPIAWTGFFGPALAVIIATRTQPLVAPSAVTVYAAVLVGLGLLNLLWGAIGAWQVTGEVAAWRYSFLADWGLALIGLGIVVPDGGAAAVLVLVSILLVRLPLYLWARPVLRGHAERAMGPSNLLLAAALAGAAPFAGFSARVLLLRGATELYWPLAVVVGLALLLWLAHSFRLARSIGSPRGRAAVGVVLALAIGILLGVLPIVVTGPAGF